MSDPHSAPGPSGNPFLGGAPFGSEPGRRSPTRRRSRPAGRTDTRATVTAVGMALAFNALTIVGVVGFGWPPGNVFALYWAENVIIGLFTVAKIATATAPGGSRTALPFFFCFHYGLFCLVQGVFTALVAYRIGTQLTFLLFWFPVIVLFVRYLVETVTVWFGPGQQRAHLSPSQAMGQPYPRIIVLQFAVIISFIALLGGIDGPNQLRALAILRELAGRIDPAMLAPGVAYVLLLMIIKTVVDLATTYRAVTR